MADRRQSRACAPAQGGERIDRIAAKLGLISDRDLADADAALLGSPVLCGNEFPADPVGAERFKDTFFKQARVVPLSETEDGLSVAMADPWDEGAARAIEFAVGRPVIRRRPMPPT